MSTNWYVSSVHGSTTPGAPAGQGTGTAYNSLVNLLSAQSASMAAGDTVWVDSAHSEIYTAAQSVTFPNTIDINVASFNWATANSPPQHSDITSGAQLGVDATTGIALTLAGSLYVNGFTFQFGTSARTSAMTMTVSGGAANNNYSYVLENCTWDFTNTTGAANVFFGPTAVTLVNPTFKFGATTQGIKNTAALLIKGGSVAATGTYPANLFLSTSNENQVLVRGMDLSNIPSGKNLVGAQGISGSQAGLKTWFDRCKLQSPAPNIAATPTFPSNGLMFQTIATHCDIGGTVNAYTIVDLCATETSDVNIVRSGGGVDFTSTGWSKKIAGNSNNSFLFPYISLPVEVVSPNTGSRTVTVYGIWDANATLPTDDQIWIDVDYPADATDTLGGFATSTTRLNPLYAAGSTSGVTSDTSSWSGSDYTGFTNAGGTKFKMQATFTQNLAGPLVVRIKTAANATFYIDPKPVVT